MHMKEEQKFWAKTQDMKLADVKEEEAPVDPFKQTFSKQIPKNTVAEKIQTQTHWMPKEEDVLEPKQKRAHKAQVKWSE